MMDYLKERVIKTAHLMLDGRRTVREVAKIVGFCKSTVHYDLTNRLKEIDYQLYLKIRELLDYNKNVRHIRGGQATKNKYSLH
ncbi:TPA: sporulation transcriptional regulator SpoIIID [Candidatus Avacholeplasma faecigallinarum]|nr:sporulation transcriptional regulator SpoIIID [Candidatus Avacholeplasma faecigallinarum]